VTAFGSADHERFCGLDQWTAVSSKRWEKRLGDGRVLQTTVHRHGTDYGPDLKAKVLRQLEVTQEQFDETLRTGCAIERSVVEAPEEQLLPEWMIQTLRRCLGQEEVASLSQEEAELLVNVYFTLPYEMTNAEVRSRLSNHLDQIRSE
jgi:hypothetical protein